MSKRRGKRVAQQCRYYEVENIFDYMYESHFASCDPMQVRRLYKELNREARRQFIEYCFDDMNPEYRREIILKVIE